MVGRARPARIFGVPPGRARFAPTGALPVTNGGNNIKTKPYDKGGSIFGCREGSFFGCHLQPVPPNLLTNPHKGRNVRAIRRVALVLLAARLSAGAHVWCALCTIFILVLKPGLETGMNPLTF